MIRNSGIPHPAATGPGGEEPERSWSCSIARSRPANSPPRRRTAHSTRPPPFPAASLARNGRQRVARGGGRRRGGALRGAARARRDVRRRFRFGGRGAGKTPAAAQKPRDRAGARAEAVLLFTECPGAPREAPRVGVADRQTGAVGDRRGAHRAAAAAGTQARRRGRRRRVGWRRRRDFAGRPGGARRPVVPAGAQPLHCASGLRRPLPLHRRRTRHPHLRRRALPAQPRVRVAGHHEGRQGGRPQLHRDPRLLEPPRAVLPRVRLAHRQPRPRGLPPHRPGGRPVRRPPARAVHLRGVELRRHPGLAAVAEAVPRRGAVQDLQQGVDERVAHLHGGRAGGRKAVPAHRARRGAGGAAADRERVRVAGGLQRRGGAEVRGLVRRDGEGDGAGAAVVHVRAGQQGGRDEHLQRILLRPVDQRPPCAAPAPASHLDRGLVRLVPEVGRAQARPPRRGPRLCGRQVVRLRRRGDQLLHVLRRHQLWPHRRRPPHHFIVRLRRPHPRDRAPPRGPQARAPGRAAPPRAGARARASVVPSGVAQGGDRSAQRARARQGGLRELARGARVRGPGRGVADGAGRVPVQHRGGRAGRGRVARGQGQPQGVERGRPDPRGQGPVDGAVRQLGRQGKGRQETPAAGEAHPLGGVLRPRAGGRPARGLPPRPAQAALAHDPQRGAGAQHPRRERLPAPPAALHPARGRAARAPLRDHPHGGGRAGLRLRGQRDLRRVFGRGQPRVPVPCVRSGGAGEAAGRRRSGAGTPRAAAAVGRAGRCGGAHLHGRAGQLRGQAGGGGKGDHGQGGGRRGGRGWDGVEGLRGALRGGDAVLRPRQVPHPRGRPRQPHLQPLAPSPHALHPRPPPRLVPPLLPAPARQARRRTRLPGPLGHGQGLRVDQRPPPGALLERHERLVVRRARPTARGARTAGLARGARVRPPAHPRRAGRHEARAGVRLPRPLRPVEVRPRAGAGVAGAAVRAAGVGAGRGRGGAVRGGAGGVGPGEREDAGGRGGLIGCVRARVRGDRGPGRHWRRERGLRGVYQWVG